MIELVLVIYVMIGMGAMRTAKSWGAESILLLFVWPIVFGFWLGERCHENQSHRVKP